MIVNQDDHHQNVDEQYYWSASWKYSSWIPKIPPKTFVELLGFVQCLEPHQLQKAPLVYPLGIGNWWISSEMEAMGQISMVMSVMSKYDNLPEGISTTGPPILEVPEALDRPSSLSTPQWIFTSWMVLHCRCAFHQAMVTDGDPGGWVMCWWVMCNSTFHRSLSWQPCSHSDTNRPTGCTRSVVFTYADIRTTRS